METDQIISEVTPIHGIAFRDETMWCDSKSAYVDYRSNRSKEKYATNIVVFTIDASEEEEGWFDSTDYRRYIQLLKGNWGPSEGSSGVGSVSFWPRFGYVDGQKAPLSVFTLMKELANRVTNIDFFEWEPQFLKGRDDSGEFFYVVHEGKNYLIEQQDNL